MSEQASPRVLLTGAVKRLEAKVGLLQTDVERLVAGQVDLLDGGTAIMEALETLSPPDAEVVTVRWENGGMALEVTCHRDHLEEVVAMAGQASPMEPDLEAGRG